MVSRQYVDDGLAGKASDASVVSVSGAETIAGKTVFGGTDGAGASGQHERGPQGMRGFGGGLGGSHLGLR